jgi:hypothetical protein
MLLSRSGGKAQERVPERLGSAVPVEVEAVRSAAKMALAFGLPPEQVLATACFGLLHAGHTGMETVLTAIEDVLEF